MTQEEILRLAAKAVELPSGLGPAETYLFMAMRSLYLQARHTDMSKEQGLKEKNAVLRHYEKMKLWIRVVEEHRRKEQEFEGAWETFAKNPTRENADKLHRAWFRCGIKPNTDGLTDEEE